MPRNCDRPRAPCAATPLSYPRAISSIAGAISSQPAAHNRMNALRRCAYCSSSRAATITAPKAALRRGLIGTDGGVGTAPAVSACALAELKTENLELGTENVEPRTTNAKATSSGVPERPALDVKFLGLVRTFHDEAEPRRRVLAHQLVDHAIGHQRVLVGDVHALQPSRARVQRRLPEHLRHHLAEALEARDLRRAAPVLALGLLLQDRFLVRIVERPERVLADVDAIERRLCEEDLAALDQLRQVPVDERQQQRGDVVAVGVGVRQDDDLAVAQLLEIEVVPEAAADRGHEIRQLLVLEHLGERRALGVQHLAAQREDGLPRAIAALLRRSAGRIAFDDEQLAAFAAGVGAVAQLAR